MLAQDLVWQLVINSPCIHSPGRVLLAWVQGTLEKRQLRLLSSPRQAQSWREGTRAQAPRACGLCRPRVQVRAGCGFEAPLLYPVAWDRVGRMAAERAWDALWGWRLNKGDCLSDRCV